MHAIEQRVLKGALQRPKPLLGMLERGGELRAIKVKNGASFSIMPVIVSNVVSDTNVMTDEARAYKQLPHIYVHEAVNHSMREFVCGNIHTNSIEGVWSLFKRGILGIQHHISPKHRDRYLTEFSFRYNTRKQGEGERVNNLLSRTDGRLTYKELIA